jgi:excisionase family DNA binding protein
MERVTIEQASLRLNVSRKTIRESIRNGELQAFRQPGPRGDQWFVELPEEGWQDRHKKAYLDLAQNLPKWWWANESNTGHVHYIEELGIEEIHAVYLCGFHSENIWSSTGHTVTDRCPQCVDSATSQGLPM